MDLNSIVDQEKINKLGFIIQLISFVKQGIKGAYVPVYNLLAKFENEKNSEKKIKNFGEVLKVFKNNSLIMEVLTNYINESWVSFNKKSDNYIIEKFKIMLEFSKIKHIYCLFDFIWNFIQIINSKMAKYIDFQNIKNFNIFTNFLDIKLDNLLSEEIENLIEFDFACNDMCEYKEFEENVKFFI